MPIRFSTEAANADVLGDDAEPGGKAKGSGTGGASRRHAFSRSTPQGRNSAEDNQAKPGKDINAAGFVKDKDSSKP
jgi:hypothetical protein